MLDKNRTRIAAAAAACLMIACLALVACGGSGGSSAASSATSGSASASSASASADSSSSASTSASASSASASASASSSAADDFTGTWLVAGARMQGLVVGGNFGEMLGVEGGFTLVLNADGTGKMGHGSEENELSWTEQGADSIYVTPQSSNGATIQQALTVTREDGALFMPYEQDGKTADLIFTRDGNYDKAKQISVADAQPITSEAALLGKWTMVGMNMGGISMYGDATTLAASMGGQELSFEFKEGGVLEMSSGEGTWAVNADGATMTTTDVTGTKTVPVVALGDEIAVDYSAAYGTDFIVLLAKGGN